MSPLCLGELSLRRKFRKEKLDKLMGLSYNDIAFWLMESLSECSSVWYERLVRDQEAAGSSPVIPIYLEPVGRHAQRDFSCPIGKILKSHHAVHDPDTHFTS